MTNLADDLEQTAPEPTEEAREAVIRRLQAENRRLSRTVGNWQLLLAEFVAQAPTLPPRKTVKIKSGTPTHAQEMVCLLSDCHATEAWTAEQTDGQTSYSFDRFCQQLWYLGQEIIRLAKEDRGKYGLKILHVDMLGDIYHGTLRLDDEVTNDFPSVPGLINTAYVLWQWLVGLSEHFAEIRVLGMAGNHGRLHQRTQSKRAVQENRDTLIYLILKLMAEVRQDGAVTIEIPGSRVYTHTRLGHRIKLGHGDHVKGGNSIAGLPIYGLSREMLRQFRKEIRRDVDQGIALIEYGHWHQYSMLENTLIINGALAPTDPYAYDELGALADPTQLVYYTSEKHVIGWRNPLSLKHAEAKHGFVYDRTFGKDA